MRFSLACSLPPHSLSPLAPLSLARPARPARPARSQGLLEKIDPDAESEGKSCCKPGLWKVVYLVLSLAGIVVGLGGCIALFALYGTSTTGAGCTLNVVLVVITLLLWLVTTVLSICNCLGIERGILTPSAVFSYST